MSGDPDSPLEQAFYAWSGVYALGTVVLAFVMFILIVADAHFPSWRRHPLEWFSLALSSVALAVVMGALWPLVLFFWILTPTNRRPSP